MKTLFNLTTSPYDLDRFSSREDLVSLIDEFGFDGVELLACDGDPRGIVPKERVVGQHMIFFPIGWIFTGATKRRSFVSSDRWKSAKKSTAERLSERL